MPRTMVVAESRRGYAGDLHYSHETLRWNHRCGYVLVGEGGPGTRWGRVRKGGEMVSGKGRRRLLPSQARDWAVEAGVTLEMVYQRLADLDDVDLGRELWALVSPADPRVVLAARSPEEVASDAARWMVGWCGRDGVVLDRIIGRDRVLRAILAYLEAVTGDETRGG